MAKKKRKKTNNEPTPETEQKDNRWDKEGKYLSRLAPESLSSLQKRKSLFMLLSTLFFAVSLFLPVDGRYKVFAVLWAWPLYMFFDFSLIGVTLYVSYQNFRKQKLRAEIYQKDAPKKGFDRFTYFSYELFNVLHILMLAIEITVGCLQIEIWGILNFFAAAASAVFSVLSRQILYRANAHNTDFLPPRGMQADNAKEGSVPAETPESEAESFYESETAGESSQSEEKADTEKTESDNEAAESFYEPNDADNGKQK